MGVKVKWNEAKQAYYVYVNHNGKRASKAFANDEKAANKTASEIRRSIKLGEFAIKPKTVCPKLGAFGDEYLKSEQHRKSVTANDYRSKFTRHIKPALSDK